VTDVKLAPSRAAIGLRLPHILEVAATRPDVGWLEVHPENFLANPHALELLTDLSNTYPISFHSVGISVGSVDGIDRSHLERIRKLVDLIHPVFVSGHLAWSTLSGEYLNDLLPLPLNADTLKVVAMHINDVQNLLGSPYLVENPSSYVTFKPTTIQETDFLSELVARTDCRLLCDVSNIVVSAYNLGFEPHRYIDELPADSISEFHLGGYTVEDNLLIDTHAEAISNASWTLYRHAVSRFGTKPTLIERDSEIPSLNTLLGEAASADTITSEVLQGEAGYANA
jgi:uncharacterized protein